MLSSGSVSELSRRGSANTSIVPGPVLRTEIVAVIGCPALTLSPSGRPLAVMAGGSNETTPWYGEDSTVPPVGENTVTTNFHRPAFGLTANACRPCVSVKAPVLGFAWPLPCEPSSVPSGAISQPASSVPALSGNDSATDSDLRPDGTSNANVSVWATNSRPLPPNSVPSNDAPWPSTGTSERWTAGSTVWSPELSEITMSCALSPGDDGIVVR